MTPKLIGKIIIANWKAHPVSESEAIKLTKESDVEGLIICPPFPFLKAVSGVIKKAKLGAQDMIKEATEAGVEYVIIGHSDRRKLGETDEIVAEKMAMAVKDGLIPILCVGETRAERDAGKTKSVISYQLSVGLSQLVASGQSLGTIVIAYEPIWAIGTGTPDSPENMLKMVQYIQERVQYQVSSVKNLRILYGGSVTSENAEEFISKDGIDGALVGGASLDSKEIKKIVEISKKKSLNI